jgi:hypothetical protein
MRQKCDDARAVVLRYGRHDRTCIWPNTGSGGTEVAGTPPRCTCGFSETLWALLDGKDLPWLFTKPIGAKD